ncbi:hypothetical protein TNCV_2053181 [Trichonephila clavipes]|nr:hypothetical protein TNCV_2053181 [Trichonephila clavipes]
MEVPLRLAYGQNGRCGMQPKPSSLRAQAHQKIVEALSPSPPNNKSILSDVEDNSVAIPLAKRSRRYNPPATHAMVFIRAIPG